MLELAEDGFGSNRMIFQDGYASSQQGLESRGLYCRTAHSLVR